MAQLTLDDSDPFQGNRDFVLNYRLAGNQITSGLILYQGDGENFFLYMAQPPQRVKSEEIPPREFIFVVDVSGSMEGFPLNTSKNLLQNLIGQMRPSDYFNVVLFAGDSTSLSPASLPANQQNVSRAIELLDQQRGSGGTELLPALKQAMSLPLQSGVSRSIVLVTDGYISGEKGAFDYIRENLGQSNVFAFGIGASVNRYLIEGVAKAGMGEPFIVEKESQADETSERFREYIQTPAMTDIKVRSYGFDTYDVFPAHIPDMLAQRPIIVFGKWRGPLTGTFELSGKTGLGDYAASVDVVGVQPDSGNLALRYLWARSRITELSDYGSSDLSESQVKEITSLGLTYNLLTPYTSFIAVREIVRNSSGDAEDIDQPLPIPLGVTDLAVGSEPELVWLAVSLALIAMFLVLKRRGKGIPDLTNNALTR